MKVKFKLAKKVYVDLIMYIAQLDGSQFNIEFYDKINVRTLYVDAMNKRERWRHEKSYYEAKKEFTISMDVNLFATLTKIGWQHMVENYETNLLFMIQKKVQPQIEQFFALNNNLYKFLNHE